MVLDLAHFIFRYKSIQFHSLDSFVLLLLCGCCCGRYSAVSGRAAYTMRLRLCIWLQVSHYVFRGLPLHLWQPGSEDLEILRRWVIGCDLKSVENHLARLIVDRMNWNVDATVSQLNTMCQHVCLHYSTCPLS